MIIRRSTGWMVISALVFAGIWGLRGTLNPPENRESAAPVSAKESTINHVKPASVRPSTDRCTFDPESKLQTLESGEELSEIPAALRFLLSQPDSSRIQELAISLCRQWAEADIQAAACWVEHMDPGPLQNEILKHVAIIWSNQNLEEALQWALQLPEENSIDAALSCVAHEAARTDPQVAIHIAATLPEASERNRLIQRAVLQWAAHSPEEAAAWACQIDDMKLRNSVLAHIGTAWSESDPYQSATYVARTLSPGKARDDAVISILQRWKQQDPDSAAQWVSMFPEGALKTNAASVLLQ